MPALTIKQFVDEFWIRFDKISNSKSGDTDQQYEELLQSVLHISNRILSYLDSQDPAKPSVTESKSKMPLLAMVSEIQQVAPDAVEKLAGQSNTIRKALITLENYSDEKRLLLRKHFLYREQADVIRFDDYRN